MCDIIAYFWQHYKHIYQIKCFFITILTTQVIDAILKETNSMLIIFYSNIM